MVDFPREIDSTMRSAFIACGKKFDWRYMQHLVPDVPNIHLHAGKCVATGLEVARRAYYGDGIEAKAAICEGARALIREWGDEEPRYGEAKGLDLALAGYWLYFDRWPLDEDVLRPVHTKIGPAVEFTFRMPTGVEHPDGGEVMYVGRFDALMEHVDTGAIWPHDDKTTGQLGEAWASQWELRAQFTGYCAAALEFGYHPAGMSVRGIRLAKGGVRTAPTLTYRESWEIERWWTQLQRDAKRMIQSWQEGYWDYALDEACVAYGGCPYRELCGSKEPERWIDMDYRREVWSPLDNTDPKRRYEKERTDG